MENVYILIYICIHIGIIRSFENAIRVKLIML